MFTDESHKHYQMITSQVWEGVVRVHWYNLVEQNISIWEKEKIGKNLQRWIQYQEEWPKVTEMGQWMSSVRTDRHSGGWISFMCSRHIHSCQQQKTCTLDQRQTKKMLVYFRNPTLSSANFHNVLWQNRNKKCFSSEMICCFIKIFHNMQNIPQSWFPKINTFSCQAREGTHFPWMKMQELQRKWIAYNYTKNVLRRNSLYTIHMLWFIR